MPLHFSLGGEMLGLKKKAVPPPWAIGSLLEIHQSKPTKKFRLVEISESPLKPWWLGYHRDRENRLRPY